MPALPQQRSPSRISTRETPGIRCEHVARLLPDALGVQQVAGVLVGHLRRHRAGRRLRGQRGDGLAEVADPGAERLRPLRPGRVVGQQLAVLLEGRAAAGRVDDDPLGVRPLERLDVLSRQPLRRLALAGVDVERAAADLVFWQVDVAAGPGQDADRRAVRLGEGDAHDAAGEEGDPLLERRRAPARCRAARRSATRCAAAAPRPRRGGRAGASSSPDARTSRWRPEPLVQPEQAREERQPLGVREQLLEDDAARGSRRTRSAGGAPGPRRASPPSGART